MKFSSYLPVTHSVWLTEGEGSGSRQSTQDVLCFAFYCLFIFPYTWLSAQWLKWSCEAGWGGAHPTKPGWSNPIPIPHPTNLALFGHIITLYRFNQGVSYYCRGAQIGATWLSSPSQSPLTLTTVSAQDNSNNVRRILIRFLERWNVWLTTVD